MSNHRRVGSSPISRTKIAKVHRTLAILFFPSAQKRPPAEDPPEAFCIYEERRRLSNDEVQDHERAQQVHDRVDLLGLAAHELDEHVHDDAGAEAVGDVAGEGREHHHDAGADGLVKVREVDLREALEHQKRLSFKNI